MKQTFYSPYIATSFTSQGFAIQSFRDALGIAYCFICVVIEHDLFASLDHINGIPIAQVNNKDGSF